MLKIFLTCEHASAEVPQDYAGLFNKNRSVLKTHRAYDIGALELTKYFENQFKRKALKGKISRLLVDLNRELSSRSLFSEFTRPLSDEERAKLLRKYHAPHYAACEKWIACELRRRNHILHIGLHTFTPRLNGELRMTDVGLLYHPSRKAEKLAVDAWINKFRTMTSEYRIRRNYPYLGKSSGLVSHLRKRFRDPLYAGIELECNQKFFESSALRLRKNELCKILSKSLSKAILDLTLHS